MQVPRPMISTVTWRKRHVWEFVGRKGLNPNPHIISWNPFFSLAHLSLLESELGNDSKQPAGLFKLRLWALEQLSHFPLADVSLLPRLPFVGENRVGFHMFSLQCSVLNLHQEAEISYCIKNQTQTPQITEYVPGVRGEVQLLIRNLLKRWISPQRVIKLPVMLCALRRPSLFVSLRGLAKFGMGSSN